MVAVIRSSGGASRQLLMAVLQRRCTMALSIPLAVEYEAVLTRPEHLAASGLDASEVGELLDAVILVAEPVRLAFLMPTTTWCWRRRSMVRPIGW
jgi:hypothetical protein